MTNDIMGTGWGALVILAIAILVHEPWRWLGLYIGNRIPLQSPVFQWVKACATALVAALVMRLVLFPAGALATISFEVRAAAFLAGIALFFASGKSLAVGVFGAAAALIATQLIVSQ